MTEGGAWSSRVPTRTAEASTRISTMARRTEMKKRQTRPMMSSSHTFAAAWLPAGGVASESMLPCVSMLLHVTPVEVLVQPDQAIRQHQHADRYHQHSAHQWHHGHQPAQLLEAGGDAVNRQRHDQERHSQAGGVDR